MTNCLPPVCTHTQQVAYCKYLNCVLCGSLLSESNSMPGTILKDDAFNSRADVSTSQLYSTMLTDQYVTRFYNPTAQYLKSRRGLIDYLREVTMRLQLSKGIFHISIAYMDYVLSKHDFPKVRLPLIALTCLVIAAKYDELDKNIPPLSDYLRVSITKLPTARVEDIKECEVVLLRILAWNLRIITPLTFVETLLTQGVVHSTDQVNDEKSPAMQTVMSVTRHALNFVESALNSIFLISTHTIDYELLQYNPSVIGIACIMAARNSAKITPVWSKHLEFISSIEYDQAKECYEALLRPNSTVVTPRVEVLETAEKPCHEKVLELNQNIFNQIPNVQPTTVKATTDSSCIGNNFIKPVVKEEKFNIKAKREQIENIKKTIKDKLISLNNKSKSIETLLEEDVPITRNTAFKSYRGAYNKNAMHAPEILVSSKNDNSVIGSLNPKDKNKSELMSFVNIERQPMSHKPNCSTIETPMNSVPMLLSSSSSNNLKEKENNKHIARPVHIEQVKIARLNSGNHGQKEIGTADPISILLQKTMRI